MKKYAPLRVEESSYNKFSALVKKASVNKKTNITKEVELALKFFISNNILPSDYDSVDINSKFDLINTKLDSMINRQFGFLTTHEKLIIANNRETQKFLLNYFDKILQSFNDFNTLYSI